MSGHERALRLVQAEPGVLVHSAADRRLAVEHWLLATVDERGRDRVRMEWNTYGLAVLPLGARLAAVRIPERVVHAVAHTDHLGMVAEFLAAALDDGPVIHDQQRCRYYALAPASMPQQWREAVPDWATLGVEFLGRDWQLGIPPARLELADAGTWPCYWAVPMSSPGMLCDPMAVGRMMAVAMRRLARDSE
ncbi:hypothetical protein ACFXPN_45895 [Streptomyces griseorubiginosus]|uniref:hypothetical protein n=1 Tax=Streptomyces griseorubiginosus TaxID=67304 RepID=UPI0036D0F177